MFSFEGTDVASDAVGILEHALRQAIPYSEAFSEGSVEALKQFYMLAREDLMRASRRARLDLYEGRDIARSDIMQARALAQSLLKEYYEKGQALSEPYRQAGYRALDKYQDTLGIPRPASGSGALAEALENRAERQGARRRLAAEGMGLINQLDINNYDSLRNMRYMAQAGLNPQGMMIGIRDNNISPKSYEDLTDGLLGPLGRTDFESPELSTASLGEDFEFGEGHEETPLETKSGDIINNLNKFVNDVRTRAKNIPGSPYNNTIPEYLMMAQPAYKDLQIARNQRSSLMDSILQGVEQAQTG